MSKSVANPEKLKKFLNKRVRLKINHSREVVIQIHRKHLIIELVVSGDVLNTGGGDRSRLRRILEPGDRGRHWSREKGGSGDIDKILFLCSSDVYSPFTQKERIEIGMVVIRGKSVESLVALEPLQWSGLDSNNAVVQVSDCLFWNEARLCCRIAIPHSCISLKFPV